MCVCVCVCTCMLSCVWLFVTPLGFSQQEYWGGLPFPPLRGLPDRGIEPVSPSLTGEFFTTEPPGPSSVSLLGTCKYLCPQVHLALLYLNKAKRNPHEGIHFLGLGSCLETCMVARHSGAGLFLPPFFFQVFIYSFCCLRWASVGHWGSSLFCSDFLAVAQGLSNGDTQP